MKLADPPFELPVGLDTPAVVVDLDILERNIASMAAEMAARGVRLRPHAKTHKSVRIARRQLEAGASGITVGTLGEAEVMADAGIDDVFIAYPMWVVGEKAQRLRSLVDRSGVKVGLDSEEGAAALGAGVRGASRRLEVLVEVDSGGHRTGTPDAASAVRVAQAASRAGLDVRGVFTHGGHSYASRDAAESAARDEIDALRNAAEALGQAGFEVRELSAGSTPTALRSARNGVTEERPGTYVFGDRQQVALGSADSASIGLAVAATVISRSIAGQVVIDAGAKALARERTPLLAGIASVPALGDAVVDRAYDYHGVIELGNTERPPVGTVLAAIPNHVCPVVNLADELIVVRRGAIVERWQVDARGMNG